MKTFIKNNSWDTGLRDTIANNYDEKVLKVFMNTIAKPHTKRLAESFQLTFLVKR